MPAVVRHDPAVRSIGVLVVAHQLAQQRITVSPDSALLPDRPVRGPLTAYAQAQMIQNHASAIAAGKTFAELPRDDPKRTVVMNASFLRASLFTSVVSFGTPAFAIGLSFTTALFGIGLHRTGR